MPLTIPRGRIAFVGDPRDRGGAASLMSRRRRFQISTRDPKDRQGSCIGLVTGVKKRPGEIHGAISIVPHPAYVHSG